MDSQAPATAQGGPRSGRVRWPVWSGVMPPLANGFSLRPETAPSVERALASRIPMVLMGSVRAGESLQDARGACGKTQLAVLAAQSLWQAHQVDLLVWVDAATRASVLTGYADAARAVLGSGLTGTAESIAARFASWLREATRPWLVVLDDLSSPEVLYGLWPEGPEGAVLITTANPAATYSERGARVHPVPAFSTREALNYIMGRLSADTDQRLGAMSLVEELRGEPLALAQAAAVLGGTTLTCGDYRDQFLRKRAQFFNANGSLLAAAVTWTLSLDQADRLSPGAAARMVLILIALLGSHGIPATVLSMPAVYEYLAGGAGRRPADASQTWDGADQERAGDALAVLEHTGLLTLGSAGPDSIVWISREVRSAVQAALPDRIRDQGATAAAEALLQAWPDDEPQTWLAGALRSCAASLISATGDLLYADGCHQLLLRAGQSLASAGLTGPAVAYWQGVTATSERVLGRDHPDTVMAAGRLADAYMAAGKAPEAAQWFEWVLLLRVSTLGQDDAATITARRNLGNALLAAGQFRDAATVLEQAAGDYERADGVDDLDAIAAREDLAAVLAASERFADASALYRRIQAERERIQGPRHPDTLATRQKLADTSLAAGRLRDARKEYKQLLADRERALGPRHPDTIAARSGLGSVCYEQGRMADALQLYERATADSEQVLGIDHRDTLAASAGLAAVLYRVGRLTEAATLMRDTLSRCERVLPQEDPLIRTVRESLKNVAGE